MKFLIIAIFLLVNSSLQFLSVKTSEQNWNCPLPFKDAIESFKNKIVSNEYPNFDIDPYTNQTAQSLTVINQTLNNLDLVCAIKYSDFNKIKYEIKNFDNSSIAIKNDFIITHQGRCGACSTLNDLAIYLSINLTVPTRQCGMLATFSESKGLKCLKDIGFSDHCAQIWLFNTKNTRKHCFMVCLVSWILNEPFTNKDGSLNECLQCDENQSGPIFKYFSGRTRRNSGIRSEIDRPTDQIYNISHCYY